MWSRRDSGRRTLITCPQWHGVAVHTLRGVVLSPLWHNITWQRSVGRGSVGTAEIGAEACLRGHDCDTVSVTGWLTRLSHETIGVISRLGRRLHLFRAMAFLAQLSE